MGNTRKINRKGDIEPCSHKDRAASMYEPIKNPQKTITADRIHHRQSFNTFSPPLSKTPFFKPCSFRLVRR